MPVSAPLLSVGGPKSGRARIVDVWVLSPPRDVPVPHVATKLLPLRWRYAFDRLPIDATYEVSEGKPRMASADRELVVVEGDGVLDPEAIERACETPLEPDDVAWFESDEHGLAPLVRVGSERARALRRDASPEATTLEELGIDGGARRPLSPGYFHRHVREADVTSVEWGLLARLQWRPGGLVARYVNRPISLRMSRFLLHRSITPNQVSVVAAVIGAIGVAGFLIPGSRRWAVAGAVLLQLNSIIDGIDGELARTRLQESRFGAYLDSVLDEILNASLLAATGYNLAASGAGVHYFWMGIVASVANFAYAAVHWHCKSRHGLGFYWWWEAYKPRKEVQRSTSWYAYFKKLFIKESIYFLYIPITILGLLPGVVWAAFGTGAVVLVLLGLHIGVVRARW